VLGRRELLGLDVPLALHVDRLRVGREVQVRLVVLALNEVWNVAFFGRAAPQRVYRQSRLRGPTGRAAKAVLEDRVAALVLAPYTAWVLVYDVPCSYRLWRLNPC
jgi:hypothetical protein